MIKLANTVIVLNVLIALPDFATPKKMTKAQIDKVVAG